MNDQQHKAECLARFKACVRAWRSRNYAHVDFVCREVERKRGKAAAQRHRDEIVRYAKSPHPA